MNISCIRRKTTMKITTQGRDKTGPAEESDSAGMLFPGEDGRPGQEDDDRPPGAGKGTGHEKGGGPDRAQRQDRPGNPGADREDLRTRWS
jgi:hypothetical protein